MLNVDIKSSRSTLYDLKVRASIHTLKECNDLMGAMNAFNYDLSRMKANNSMRPSDCYEAEIQYEPKRMTIYHLNSTGDRDRIVAIISEIIQHS